MPISLLTNLPAIKSRGALEVGARRYEEALERLSSGKRVNKPGDDPAGLSLAFAMEARTRSISQATRNAGDGLSVVQVAGSGITEIGNILVRLRELAIQSASDTIGDKERASLNVESTQLVQEIDRIAEATTYLDTALLNGSGRSFDFFIGADASEVNKITYDSGAIDVRASTLGVDGINMGDKDDAQDAFEEIDNAISRLGNPLAVVGAMQARLRSAINHLENYNSNLIAAQSRITDADLAEETTKMVQGRIQQHFATAVLSQANSYPELALQLL